MRTGSLLFLAGVLLLLQCRELPPASYLLPPVTVVLLALLRWRHSLLLQSLLWLLCGFCWAWLRADWILDHSLPRSLEGEPLIVQGRIDSLPLVRDTDTRFILAVERLQDTAGVEQPHPDRIRLGWYDNAPELMPGDVWRLTVKLKRPWGFANPGGFDYEGWLFQQGVRATGYVLDSPAGKNRFLQAADADFIDRIRYRLRAKLSELTPAGLAQSLLPALALGDRSRMSDHHWQVLNSTGTNHLLAISGLHIGLVAGLVLLLFRRLWALSSTAVHLLASPRAAAVAAIAAAVIYAALAGFSVPTQRALIMTGIVLLESCFFYRTSLSRLYCLALLLVLIVDPFAVMSAGFWLSFGAVAVILFGMAGRLDTDSIWWRWGRSQYLVAVGLAPLLMLWFQQIPVLSIAANTIAVPWVSLVSVPLVLAGTGLIPVNEFAAGQVLWLASQSLNLLWWLLEVLAGASINVVSLAAPSATALVAACAGVVLLLAPAGIPGRWLGWVGLLPMICPVSDLPVQGEFRLVLLDVGQGLAAVIRTRNHLVLYDTGPGYSQTSNAGGSVIVPWLRFNGLSGVDLLVQSHADYDHIGGLRDVLKAVPVNRVVTGTPRRTGDIMSETCHRGQVWEFDGVNLEMLHPGADSDFTGNNASCVLRVTNEKYALLLTGDIERSIEYKLVREQAQRLQSDVLVAPHHGSRTSSSQPFIGKVDPGLVLFTAGYRNRFDFPNKDIMKRYTTNRVAMLDTVRSGAIEIRFHATGMELIRHRQRLHRFWHNWY